MAVQQDRNSVVSASGKRVVDVVDTGAEIGDMDEFGRNIALGSLDANSEGFSSDSLEIVGLCLCSNRELEVLDESVFVGSSFLDVDCVWGFGDGIVLESDVDGVLAVFGRAVVDGVRAVVIVDNLGGHVGVGSNYLDFEGVSSFAHVVAVAITGLDVELSGFCVVDVFETRTPDQRVGGVSSGLNGNIVRRVFDVVVVEGFLCVEDDVDLVVSGIDGLVVDGVGTILVIDDLGLDFVADGVINLGIDGVTSNVEGLSLVILGDDGEGREVGSVSSFQTGSKDIEFRRIGIAVTAVDGDVPWAS